MKKNKRTTEWYRKNESKVMKKLGFKPTAMSGAGLAEKEDGENDIAISQLKTTEAEAFKLSLLDIDKLVFHANEAHKIPVFVVEFYRRETLVCIRPEDLERFCEYYITGEFKPIESEILLKPSKSERPKIRIDKVEVIKDEEDEEKEETIDDVFKRRAERKKQQKERLKYKPGNR